jgi:hypothetical protein
MALQSSDAIVADSEEIIIIERGHPPRRTFLKVVGAAFALPAPDVKTPAHFLERVANAYTGRQAIQYGERERPETRAISLLIDAQVAHAPRTAQEVAPISLTRNRKSL